MARRLTRVRSAWVLAAVFATMLVAGLLLGGFGQVLANGIVICLDCIGLI
jgi:hypothetical protein